MKLFPEFFELTSWMVFLSPVGVTKKYSSISHLFTTTVFDTFVVNVKWYCMFLECGIELKYSIFTVI